MVKNVSRSEITGYDVGVPQYYLSLVLDLLVAVSFLHVLELKQLLGCFGFYYQSLEIPGSRLKEE